MTKPRITSRSFFCRARFCLEKLETRFGTEEWFISDANTVSDADVRAGKAPEVVYQGNYPGALAFIKREQEKAYA